MEKSTGKFAKAFKRVLEEGLMDGIATSLINKGNSVATGNISDIDLKTALSKMNPNLTIKMYKTAEAGGGDDDLAAFLNSMKDFSTYDDMGTGSINKVQSALKNQPGTAKKILQFLRVDATFQQKLKLHEKDEARHAKLFEDTTAGDAGVGSTGGFSPSSNINSSDFYAPGDARNLFGKYKKRKPKVQRRKKKDEDAEEPMCPDACCGKPVSECKCGPDCPHCDCYEINNA